MLCSQSQPESRLKRAGHCSNELHRMMIPGSSKCVEFVPFHQKKPTIYTYLEDPGILILKIFDPPKKMLFKITQLTFFQFVLAPGYGGQGSCFWFVRSLMVSETQKGRPERCQMPMFFPIFWHGKKESFP